MVQSGENENTYEDRDAIAEWIQNVQRFLVKSRLRHDVVGAAIDFLTQPIRLAIQIEGLGLEAGADR